MAPRRRRRHVQAVLAVEKCGLCEHIGEFILADSLKHPGDTVILRANAARTEQRCRSCKRTGRFPMQLRSFSSAAQDQVKADTIHYCNTQPDPTVRSACLAALKEYGTQLYVDEVQHHQSSHGACTALGQCMATQVRKFRLD